MGLGDGRLLRALAPGKMFSVTTEAGVAVQADARRLIPSISRLLEMREVQALVATWGREAVVMAARQVAAQARLALEEGRPLPGDWAAAVEQALQEAFRPSLQPAINATGVIVHTNLGRAPLSAAALEAIVRLASGYCNLEYELDEGRRGSRYKHAARQLCALTGAQAALVVNNNAAAVLLVLAALAAGREVVISRGQLVEIGGGFRIPEVLAQSGARLVEVGTTNRTYVSDYVRAIGQETAMFLFVHRSNFALLGFVHEPSIVELAEAAHGAGLLLVVDLGSGCLLPTEQFVGAHEPTPQDCLAAGADIVTFSADKLFGGPQAGIILGKQELIQKLEGHPLLRALRVDKLTLAALEATARLYRQGRALQEIPVWRMMAAPAEELRARAERWCQELGLGEVRRAESTIGGGSLPGQVLPTYVLAIPHEQPQLLAAALRRASPPIIARVAEGALLLDPRTVREEEEAPLLAALKAALHDSRLPLGRPDTSSEGR